MSRFDRAFAALVREVFPNYAFLSSYKYRVVQMNPGDNRVHLQSVRKDLGLPDVLPISIMPGIPGAKSALTEEAIVLVSFIEGDPTQPIVTHFSAPGEVGFVPVSLAINATASITLGEEPTFPVARVGDTVQAGPFVGVVTSGSAKVRSE